MCCSSSSGRSCSRSRAGLSIDAPERVWQQQGRGLAEGDGVSEGPKSLVRVSSSVSNHDAGRPLAAERHRCRPEQLARALPARRFDSHPRWTVHRSRLRARLDDAGVPSVQVQDPRHWCVSLADITALV